MKAVKDGMWECTVCGRYKSEDQMVTSVEGHYICDSDDCGVMDEDCERHMNYEKAMDRLKLNLVDRHNYEADQNTLIAELMDELKSVKRENKLLIRLLEYIDKDK